ncbi:hypothetical protein, partial [Streptomyces sp. WAC04114]|uniref:hypothetical protein n=1 Tax=Streptomyces sp. WAC04114 TaxID=2867961 RepID=UPI001C8C1FBE
MTADEPRGGLHIPAVLVAEGAGAVDLGGDPGTSPVLRRGQLPLDRVGPGGGGSAAPLGGGDSTGNPDG